ncbi:hypothetical protein EDB85DRAFT_1896502 [Lactarius pseudohatsudake]|nr:hypothetical protein EDB85DRAFT_1896502 [Lactarius pseudohatsudake]
MNPPLSNEDDDCFSVQLGGSDPSPRAPKVTILRQRFPMRRYNWENGGRLTNLAKDMDPFTSTSVDAITQSIATILQPHTSSPTLLIVTRAMTSLVTANIRGDNLDQLFSIHLNSLAISPQTKTPVGPDQVSAAQELLGPKIRVAATAAPGGTYASYQSHQRPFNSSSGSGYTIWYFSRSDSSIQSPPMVPQSKTGHLYVHFDASTKTHQYWMLGVGGQWEVVSRNSEYPLNHVRVLSICSNGEPSWVT